MLYKNLDSEVALIAKKIRANPEHMVKLHMKEQAIWDRPEEFIAHKNFYEEYFFFDEGEDITIYADLHAKLPPLPQPPKELRINPHHRHEFFEMVYVYSGECKIFYNGEVHSLNPDSLWLMDTRCRHGIDIIDRENGLVFNILVRSSTFNSSILNMIGENDLFLSFFLDSFSKDKENYMRFEIEKGETAEFYIFNLISEYYNKQPNSQSILKFMYSSLLVELSRKYKSKNLLASEGLKTEIVDIIAYISSRASTVTLKELSEHFHYSPAHISRLITAHTGLSFAEYLRRFRLSRGAYLLTHSELSMEKIAEEAGYRQRSSFDKEFKKLYGKTPAMYRKNNL